MAEAIATKWSSRRPQVPRDAIDKALEYLPALFTARTPYVPTADMRVRVRTFSSQSIGRFVTAISLDTASGIVELQMKGREYLEMEVLKELVWYYVIERPSLASQQHGQVAIVNTLFKVFLGAANPKKSRVATHLLPAGVQESLIQLENSGVAKPADRARIVCDGICGLTELEAQRLYERLIGVSIGSVGDPLVGLS